MSLSIFGFRALWSPWFFLTVAIIVILYFLLTVKWRNRFTSSTPVTKKQVSSFLSGMVLLHNKGCLLTCWAIYYFPSI